jgi:hypothetical protein
MVLMAQKRQAYLKESLTEMQLEGEAMQVMKQGGALEDSKGPEVGIILNRKKVQGGADNCSCRSSRLLFQHLIRSPASPSCQ